MYKADLSDGGTFTVTRENKMKLGSLTVHKVNAAGNSLSGVSIRLEKSTDSGKTWKTIGAKATGVNGIAA